jgi:hypothetical protein
MAGKWEMIAVRLHHMLVHLLSVLERLGAQLAMGQILLTVKEVLE